MYVILFFLIINLIGFFAMYIDKKRAINKQWRISESTLILISIVGGSLGTILGMKLFRHKTRHLKFNTGVPLILALQLAILFILKIYSI